MLSSAIFALIVFGPLLLVYLFASIGFGSLFVQEILFAFSKREISFWTFPSILLMISTVFSFLAWKAGSGKVRLFLIWLPLTLGCLFMLFMISLNMSIFGSDYSKEELQKLVIQSTGYSILVAQVLVVPWSWFSLKLLGLSNINSREIVYLRLNWISRSIPKFVRFLINATFFLTVCWFALLPFGSADWIAKQASPTPEDYFKSYIGNPIPPQIIEIKGKCFKHLAMPYGLFEFKYAGAIKDVEIFRSWISAEQPPDLPTGSADIRYSTDVLWTREQGSVKFLHWSDERGEAVIYDLFCPKEFAVFAEVVE